MTGELVVYYKVMPSRMAGIDFRQLLALGARFGRVLNVATDARVQHYSLTRPTQ